MTEAEIKEFWKNQTLFTSKDVITKGGLILLSPEAMQRVQNEYQLEIVPGRIYTLREARDVIIEAETKKRTLENASGLEESAEAKEENKYVSYLRYAQEHRKDDYAFMGRELDRLFKTAKIEEVEAGIRLAEEQGIIANSQTVIASYHGHRRLRALSINFQNLGSLAEKGENITGRAAKIMASNYRLGCSYRDMVRLLNESSIPEATRKDIINQFYEILAPMIEKHCKDTKYAGGLLAKEILAAYPDLDKERIFAILEASGMKHIDFARMKAYQMDVEPKVVLILKNASKERLEASTIVEEVLKVSSEYPRDYVVKTLELQQSKGLILPYNGMFAVLDPSKKQESISEVQRVLLEISKKHMTKKEEFEVLLSKFSEEEVLKELDALEKSGLVLPYEEIRNLYKKVEKEGTGLVPVERKPAVLGEDGHFSETIPEPQVEAGDSILDAHFESISTGTKHKIKKREKATSKRDKKSVVTAILVALGAVSTAVLVCSFGVSALTAAKNTVASIMAFAMHSPTIEPLLPAAGKLISNLAAFGVAAAGIITWLKRKGKKNKESRKEEIREVLEEIMSEEEEKGGKTR